MLELRAQRLTASKVFALKLHWVEIVGISRAQRLTASKVFAPPIRRSCALTQKNSAQRLTASKVFARCQTGACPGRSPVLNALRHQRFLHLFSSYPRSDCRPVLNALRHQRFLHFCTLIRALPSNSACSTPYGIKGFCTSLANPPSVWRTSAQRLTASKVFAQAMESAFLAQGFRCSTPYGIKGFCTFDAAALDISVDPCSTPYGIKGFCTDSGHTPGCVRLRAQRLTASKVFAQGRTDRWAPAAYLCSTPYGIKGFCTRWLPTITRQWEACSTPYGIKGFCTQRLPSTYQSRGGAQRLTASKVFAQSCQPIAVRYPRVLNALRHQRFLHWYSSDRHNKAIACSTPYGIKGFCT